MAFSELCIAVYKSDSLSPYPSPGAFAVKENDADEATTK